MSWRENIQNNQRLVKDNLGPTLVTVVSGTELDRRYWQQHFAATQSDVFRADASSTLISVCEPVRKGNFLGTLAAWTSTLEALNDRRIALPDVSLMSMVFGQGKRLSPFTQSLGNRKSALPTPLRGSVSHNYLRTADLSNLYANAWVQHLRSVGFHGLVVKWGDEAVVPSVTWDPHSLDYRQLDAFRFVWKTAPTVELAREKDWILIDPADKMQYQYARQPMEHLNRRLAHYSQAGYSVGVNLGSLAVSYQFLDLALDIFREDLAIPGRWVDWDPYVWMALFCATEADWHAEAEREQQIGKSGIRDLGVRYPDFYAKITRLRDAVRDQLGRPFAVGVLDFGLPLWTDFGLHTALRTGLLEILNDSERGAVARDLFALPHARDGRGNIIVNSELPAGADIRNSVICDSVILSDESVVHDAVVIGGRLRRAHMPQGGAVIFSAADDLVFSGANAISLRSVAAQVHLPGGGRHTTLFLDEGPEQVVTNESVIDYEGANYTQPILGNGRAFDDAARKMSVIDGELLERRWLEAWQGWLA